MSVSSNILATLIRKILILYILNASTTAHFITTIFKWQHITIMM